MIILFNKPYGVLSQFTDKNNPSPRPTLSQYIDKKGYYPAGRLDRDSEGLLLLTNNGKLQAQISHPQFKMPKTYWVQVEGAPSLENLQPLRDGLQLKDGQTQPAKAKLLPAPKLWDRIPPIRERKNIPDTWLEITISEGRNRQIRRMTAAIGFPTLRLVRVRIGDWSLEDLPLGEYRLIQ